jgi:hypothetical protein
MFALALVNLYGLADLVPVADIPPEPALEPVALKTSPQSRQFPLSGSKLDSPPELVAHRLSSTYAMHSCPGLLFHLHSRLYDLLSTVVETSAFPNTITILRLQHLLLALVAFSLFFRLAFVTLNVLPLDLEVQGF